MPKLVYHDSDGVDKVLNLGAEPLTIGRATECEIQTQDAMVSRRHARITWDGNYWIEDLGSSNGVYVGPDKVQKAPFRPGDTVTCGSLVMRMLPDTAPRTAASLPSHAMTQPAPPPGRERAVTLPPPPMGQPMLTPALPQDPIKLELDHQRNRCNQLELQVAELQRQLAESTASETSARPAVAQPDAQVADTVILLSDAVAQVRSSLRAANGEATLLKQPEESVQVVRDSLRTALEGLDQARQHLRSLAKLLGV